MQAGMFGEGCAGLRFVTKGGVGYGVDETQKVVDDGKGWVWLAAEMSPGGACGCMTPRRDDGCRRVMEWRPSDGPRMNLVCRK